MIDAAKPVHFVRLSRFRQTCRTLIHDTLGRLGVRSHVVRAQGARFRVNTADYIDRCLALFGIWDEAQLERLAALASAHKFDAFLDIGANTGFYSVMFATKRLCPRILAFEPDPGNYARLMANLRLNDLVNRVEAVPVALGERTGEVTLYQGYKGNLGESTIAAPEQTPRDITHLVRVARFDDLHALAGQILMIKIDVEGYEFEVLAGMQRTLRDNACYVQLEHYGERLPAIQTIFMAIGYRFLDTHDIDHYFTNIPGIG